MLRLSTCTPGTVWLYTVGVVVWALVASLSCILIGWHDVLWKTCSKQNFGEIFGQLKHPWKFHNSLFGIWYPICSKPAVRRIIYHEMHNWKNELKMSVQQFALTWTASLHLHCIPCGSTYTVYHSSHSLATKWKPGKHTGITFTIAVALGWFLFRCTAVSSEKYLSNSANNIPVHVKLSEVACNCRLMFDRQNVQW